MHVHFARKATASLETKQTLECICAKAWRTSGLQEQQPQHRSSLQQFDRAVHAMLGCRHDHDHARLILFSKSYITHGHSPPCRCSYRDEAHQSRSLRSYQVERAFYAHIAPLLRDRGIALPEVLAAVWGGDNMQGITILEDLGSAPGATGEPSAAATRMLVDPCNCSPRVARGVPVLRLRLWPAWEQGTRGVIEARVAAGRRSCIRLTTAAAPPGHGWARNTCFPAHEVSRGRWGITLCCADERAEHGRSPLQRLALDADDARAALAWLAAFHAAGWVPPDDEAQPAPAGQQIRDLAQEHLWPHGIAPRLPTPRRHASVSAAPALQNEHRARCASRSMTWPTSRCSLTRRRGLETI